MFRKLVSNLPFSPQLINQISFYANRLKRETVTRRLAVIFAIVALGVQIFAFVAPPQSSTAASSNDVICGGLRPGKEVQDLLAYYDAGNDFCGNGAIKELFAYYNINRDMLARSHLTTINSSQNTFWSVGRNPHSSQDVLFKVGLYPLTHFYARPLNTWGHNANYKALVGNNGIAPFWILVNCGNLVALGPPPAPPTPPSPPPTPPPQPPPTPPQSPTPTPPQSPPPKLTFEKTVANTSRPPSDPARVNADRTTAKAGETLEYALTTRNIGGQTQSGYVFEENIRDILEYADVVDAGGATITNGIMKWPAVNIKVNETLVKRFKVKIKDPVPATPTARSDPQSFDLCMDNVFEQKETRVCINIPPPPKVVELTTQQLPNTGPGLDIAIGSVFSAIAGFFFLRNRQLIKELQVVQHDYNQGGS